MFTALRLKNKALWVNSWSPLFDAAALWETRKSEKFVSSGEEFHLPCNVAYHGEQRSCFFLSTQTNLTFSNTPDWKNCWCVCFLNLQCTTCVEFDTAQRIPQWGKKFGYACFNHSLFLWQLGVPLPSASLVITEWDRERASESERTGAWARDHERVRVRESKRERVRVRERD